MSRKESMLIWNKPTLYAILLCLLFASSNAFSDRGMLAGFGEFEFGLSEQEVRARIEIEDERMDTVMRYEPALILEEKGITKVQGMEFTRLFIVYDAKLVGIQLSREQPEIRTGCDNWFDRVFGMLRARYGDPDTEVNRSLMRDILQTTRARFTFGNGAAITLGAVWTHQSMSNEEEPKCRLLVTYEGPPPGDQF